MLTDPWMKWRHGVFPYDHLGEVGINPDSSMKSVHRASFDLIELGTWDRSHRASWDALRKVDRRLWVDFLMYTDTPDEIARRLAPLVACVGKTSPAELAALSMAGRGDLETIEQEFRAANAVEVPLNRLVDFDEPLEVILEKVKFDEGKQLQ